MKFLPGLLLADYTDFSMAGCLGKVCLTQPVEVCFGLKIDTDKFTWIKNRL